MISYSLLAFLGLPFWATATLAIGATVLLLVAVLLAVIYGGLWLQAKASGTDVSLSGLVGMSLRNVSPYTIVNSQVMANQAGVTISTGRGSSTSALEAHYLAGGDVNRVILAIIAANRAGLDLDFDRAAAIDLSGRDLSEAVKTSIFPKVIDCPDPNAAESARSLSAVAKNGVELLIRVRVTVRTDLDQLIGGATEETIIARVGQGIVSTVGSMDSHEEALASPNLISKEVFEKGIQENTAYEIVSIDVASIDVGRNIGARLQTEQAEADTRVARAGAEMRRAEALALLAEMVALVAEKKASVILAESEIQSALAQAFRDGLFHPDDVEPADPDSILRFPGSQSSA